MPDDQFDLVRNIELAKEMFKKYGGTPKVIYISREQYELLSEELKISKWEGQDGKEYILGLELRKWEDMIPKEGGVIPDALYSLQDRAGRQ